MFNNTKYTTCYYRIINRAKTRVLDGYKEVHHIIPKCLGGCNNEDNLVSLTGHEHYVCHLLLTKMVDSRFKFKLIKAAMMMAKVTGPGQERVKVTGRIYEMLKKSCPPIPESVTKKMSESQRIRFKSSPGTFLNKKHTQETLKKLRTPKTEKQKTHQSLVMKGKNLGKIPHNKGKTNLELYGEERAAEIQKAQSHRGIKNGFFGKKPSDEQIQKKRIEKLNEPKKECPHCGKFIGLMNYGRWHGEKCKQRT
jgi:5-methylcytosine-specific restriction endonuclease McrA